MGGSGGGGGGGGGGVDSSGLVPREGCGGRDAGETSTSVETNGDGHRRLVLRGKSLKVISRGWRPPDVYMVAAARPRARCRAGSFVTVHVIRGIDCFAEFMAVAMDGMGLMMQCTD